MDGLTEAAALFAIVFALNVIPAFAPPTWMALSWVGFSHPLGNPFVVAAIGALAATAGRIVLAKLARIVRRRWISDAMRENIDVVKEGLERHRTMTFSGLLIYAFGPLPSNYLFIAYGLTALPLWLAAVPFFIGRCASYTFFVFTASAFSRRLPGEATEAQPYFSIYFVVSQALLLGAVIALARVDWRYLMTAKRLRWMRRANSGAS